MVVSVQPISLLTEPEGVKPQDEVNLYLALMVQQPGVFDNELFTWFKALL